MMTDSRRRTLLPISDRRTLAEDEAWAALCKVWGPMGPPSDVGFDEQGRFRLDMRADKGHPMVKYEVWFGTEKAIIGFRYPPENKPAGHPSENRGVLADGEIRIASNCIAMVSTTPYHDVLYRWHAEDAALGIAKIVKGRVKKVEA